MDRCGIIARLIVGRDALAQALQVWYRRFIQFVKHRRTLRQHLTTTSGARAKRRLRSSRAPMGAIGSAHRKASPLKGVSYRDGVATMPMATDQFEAGFRTAVLRSSLAMMR